MVYLTVTKLIPFSRILDPNPKSKTNARFPHIPKLLSGIGILLAHFSHSLNVGTGNTYTRQSLRALLPGFKRFHAPGGYLAIQRAVVTAFCGPHTLHRV